MCAKSNCSSDKKNCFVIFHAEAFIPFFMLSMFFPVSAHLIFTFPADVV